MNENLNELNNFLKKKFCMHPLKSSQTNEILSLVEFFELKEIYKMINIAYKKIIIEQYDCWPTENANNDFMSYFFGIIKNKQKDLFDEKRDYIINIIKKAYPKWQMYIVKKSICNIFDKLKTLNVSDKKLIAMTDKIIDLLYNKYNHFESFYEFEDICKIIVGIPIYQP